MIQSMTGYGKSSVCTASKKINVEIKSINSKQLDLCFRIPSCFREQENSVRNEISPVLERGKVEISVSIENIGTESGISINRELLREYKKEISEISDELKIEAPEDWFQVLLRLPDVYKTENHEPDNEEIEGFRAATLGALESLVESRLIEGRKLYDFFFRKLERITALLEETEKYESQRVPKIKSRLEEQLKKLESIEYDKGRLEQELIFYIEKLDVTEEKVRLRSHLNYFEETLGEPEDTMTGGKGKKLGFIAQEMGREINTLGSKSNDADMQKIVVMLKDELEQIKEQVLNVL